ncbi:hypothetical protein GN956_G13226 [Arapaima gigas]
MGRDDTDAVIEVVCSRGGGLLPPPPRPFRDTLIEAEKQRPFLCKACCCLWTSCWVPGRAARLWAGLRVPALIGSSSPQASPQVTAFSLIFHYRSYQN